jgi:Fur family transcriptional regulator, zinc uptake regulator
MRPNSIAAWVIMCRAAPRRSSGIAAEREKIMPREPGSARSLTPNETAVLGMLRAANGPMTAYQILGRFSQEGSPVAPPTVYRALKGLERSGAARRIESLRAWTPSHLRTSGVVAICHDCGSVCSVEAPQVFHCLSESLAAQGFVEARQVVEVHGRCGDCTGGAR